ncbi:hypothetical protein NDU88_008866 [Pleurodeles waltl]|uniref:Uncharacterized protein n=1 Tax=Pleurodeles waltl TaxID=8319 RepID=A0AAV7RWS1_PLEWA|nr:hypothetical protein NDU88_008866 [Pleurodeles waltl]
MYMLSISQEERCSCNQVRLIEKNNEYKQIRSGKAGANVGWTLTCGIACFEHETYLGAAFLKRCWRALLQRF